MQEFNSSNDEELIVYAQGHWASIVPHVVLTVLVLLSLIAIRLTVIKLATLWIVLVPLAIIAKPLVQLFTTSLTVTSTRLIGKTGLISTRSLDSPLNKVNNVMVESGLLGKIFVYGNLVVSTSSGAYVFHNIEDPEHVRQSIMSQVAKLEEDRAKKQAVELANAIRGGGQG